jgi:hypothetical protein
LCNLGAVAISLNDVTEAARLLTEGITIQRELKEREGVASSLLNFSDLEVLKAASEDHDAKFHLIRAAILLGASDALRAEVEVKIPQYENAEYEQFVNTIREGVGKAEFLVAWEQGQAMTLDEAVEFAMMTVPSELL